MTLRRSFPSLAMTVVLIVAAAAGLGLPNWTLAAQFLFGNYPSNEAALAVAAIVCWFVIVVVALTTVIVSIRAVTEAQLVQHRWTRATMFVTAGAIVLTMGLLHHASPGYSMCCGYQAQHVQEATQLAGNH